MSDTLTRHRTINATATDGGTAAAELAGTPPPPAAGPPAPEPRAPLYTDTGYDGLGLRRALLNNKGGVAKTGSTVALSAALARRGRRVLVLDFDPQGNATRRLGVTPDRYTPAGTISDVLARGERGGAWTAIVPCGWGSPEAARIDVIPADTTLGDRDLEAHLTGADNRLRRALYHPNVTDRYDYLLVDCRPAMGHLERMVVRALDGDGDGYLIPIEPGADAIGGAARLMEEVAEWADRMEIDVRPLGVVVNLYMGRTVMHRGRVGEENPDAPGADAGTGSLAASLTFDGRPVPVLRPYIPRNQHLSEVFDLGAPVGPTDTRLTNEGIVARYDQLAEEIDR